MDLRLAIPLLVLAAATRPQEPGDDVDRAHVKAMRYFAMCDYDGDGVVVFKEAEQSLRLDRDQFRAYDRDHDGVVSPEEFEQRYRVLSARAGGFEPPREKPTDPVQPDLTPGELVANYDVNRDGGLSMREIERALDDYLRSELDAEFLVEKLDADRSGMIEAREVADLLSVISPTAGLSAEPADPKSVIELFGARVPRDDAPGSAPRPARILGPVPHFYRLDFDGDGVISAHDLNALKRPLTLPVHVPTLISYLDQNGDGVLSEAEFYASMGAKKPKN